MNDSKVDFVIIGVQKCGTTSLAHQLEQHPDVDFCFHKEPDFFSKSKDWRKGLDSYHKLYKNTANCLKGEGSTTYSWLLEYPETVDRLYEYNPNLKLIFMVRNPVDRIRSHFGHEFSKGRVEKPIEEEIRENPAYVRHSLYAGQIKPFIERFGQGQIHYLKFEDFVLDGLSQLNEVLVFLGLKEMSEDELDLSPKNEILQRKAERPFKRKLAPYVRFLPEGLRRMLKGPFEYKLTEKPQLKAEFREELWSLLYSDLREFEQLSGLDLSNYSAN